MEKGEFHQLPISDTFTHAWRDGAAEPIGN